MTKEPFIVHCVPCGHEWALAFLPIPVDLMARLSLGSKCPACGGENVSVGPLARETQDGDAIGWLSNGDTGISSMTIWHVMMGRRLERSGFPYDPADFGRCYRLLKVMPSWRGRLGEVSEAYPDTPWPRLIAAWDELTSLYEAELPSGRCPRLYARMQALINEVRS